MVSVMKVEKAPLESYADIGGLDEAVELLRGLILHIFGFKIYCSWNSFYSAIFDSVTQIFQCNKFFKASPELELELNDKKTILWS